MQPDSVKQYKGQPYQETNCAQAITPDGFIKRVAHIYQGDGGTGSPQALDEQAANMALICAAPELLKQLKAARQYVAKVAADHAAPNLLFASRRLDRMNAAIAKAEGGAA